MPNSRSPYAPFETIAEERVQTLSSQASRVNGERLLTVKEAAQSLGLCVDSVRRHLRSGKLQGVRVGGGWRVPESKLAVQLGLLSVASVPALEVIEEERKYLAPKMAPVAGQQKEANNELLDTLLQTQTVRTAVLKLVEEAGVAAGIPVHLRFQLAQEIKTALDAPADQELEL